MLRQRHLSIANQFIVADLLKITTNLNRRSRRHADAHLTLVTDKTASVHRSVYHFRLFRVVGYSDTIIRCAKHTSRGIRSSLVPLRNSRTNRIIGVICSPLPPRDFAECLPISRMIGRAVGIEIASLLHKVLHGNDLAPSPQLQLLLNVVRLNFPDFCSPGYIRLLDMRRKGHYQCSLPWARPFQSVYRGLNHCPIGPTQFQPVSLAQPFGFKQSKRNERLNANYSLNLKSATDCEEQPCTCRHERSIHNWR